MSTLSEHTGNGTPAKIRLQSEGSKERIDAVLDQFDVLTTRFDRFIFRYFYIFVISTFSLAQLLLIPSLFPRGVGSFQFENFLLGSGLDAFPVVASILVLWRFNVWRVSTPKTLHDLLEKKRIYVPDGDVTTSYYLFLEDYHAALASPRRYFLSGSLMLLVSILYAYNTYLIAVERPNISVTIIWVGENLLGELGSLIMSYCIGIGLWAMYISGWYIRKLVRVFGLRIEPLHTDKCGGLKVLGSFCFGIVSPLLIGSALTIGYIVALLLGIRFDVVLLALNVGLGLLLLVLFLLPAIIFAFIFPLRDIHRKMVSEGEADEDAYNARIEALREEIQALLATKQIEAAKAVQEEKAVLETLHTPYPSWPVSFRSKIISTVLGVSGSLLIGAITAVFQQYFFPAIFSLLFHHP